MRLALLAVFSTCSGPAIVDAPLTWSAEREALTLEYRRQHSDPDAKDLTITPQVIVLHYTGGGSAKATRAYFDNVRIERGRKDLARAGRVNVSSHFLVDRMGRHIGDLLVLRDAAAQEHLTTLLGVGQRTQPVGEAPLGNHVARQLGCALDVVRCTGRDGLGAEN